MWKSTRQRAYTIMDNFVTPTKLKSFCVGISIKHNRPDLRLNVINIVSNPLLHQKDKTQPFETQFVNLHTIHDY